MSQKRVKRQRRQAYRHRLAQEKLAGKRDASSPEQEEGRMKTMDLAGYRLSFVVGLMTEAILSHCYGNAWRALSALPELFAEGSLAEGWLVLERPLEVQIIEHGWCELSTGRIVDPTLPLLAAQGQPVFFFPGLCHPRAQIISLPPTMLPLVLAGTYGDDGFGHPGYKAAYEAAWRQARQLASASGKPVEIYLCQEEEHTSLFQQQRHPPESH